ncbi:hypothetical protein [Streptomyces angustmyceticus]|uniref:hypothetical protein n=1 Tax=Streptomyces angustmyceticus TaxID=285578 RepID=UPI00381B37EB
MNRKIAALGVTLPALLALSAPPASAAENPAATASASAKGDGTQTAMVKRDIGCRYRANDPGHLTAGSKTVWATVQITGCTPTPPDKCHLTIHLANPVYNVAHKDDGWKSCKKKTLKVKYKCADVVSKREFVTVGTLAMVYRGVHNSHTFTSRHVTLFCR